MKLGRTVGNLVAVFADLKLAVAVGGADYESGFTFFVWRPLVAPQTPAQLGASGSIRNCNQRLGEAITSASFEGRIF
jgi:hypothetical protein